MNLLLKLNSHYYLASEANYTIQKRFINAIEKFHLHETWNSCCPSFVRSRD